MKRSLLPLTLILGLLPLTVAAAPAGPDWPLTPQTPSCGLYDFNTPDWPWCWLGFAPPQPGTSLPPLPPLPPPSTSPGGDLQCTDLGNGTKRCVSGGSEVIGPTDMVCRNPASGVLSCTSGTTTTSTTASTGAATTTTSTTTSTGAATSVVSATGQTVAAPESGAASRRTARPTLRCGAAGAAVAELQRRLNRWITATPATGLSRLVVDGRFGPRTAAAVRAFQQMHGLSSDGIVGPQTWQSLLLDVDPTPAPAAMTPTVSLPLAVSCTG